MIRVFYFSTARANVSDADVDRIVHRASAKNADLGITGALAYNGRNFCQLLEGDEEKVMALLEEIEADPRHSGFKVLDKKEVASRAFPDWSIQRVSALDFSVVINAMQS
ncbi:BLUF domain-containing protein [Marimonas sp. MJW-29]|uniref:BLUF domain-containing protein n=1 Tax=Sulfitobacter sediminis TaxID=3234186 RepID=A0ABV3RHT8_9RHOB